VARNTVVPLDQMQRRIPEAGRIRIGVKTGRAMKSIDTFRFTSPYRDLIEKLASMYGGTARPWTDDRARIKDQYEVITQANQVPVVLPPDGLSVWYEKWSGGGCERRCDGITVETVQMRGDNAEPINSPCICTAKNLRECQPYTRLTVLLPELAFRGSWRLETKGWNAAHELPGMYELITNVDQGRGLVSAMLGVEQRSDKAAGKTRHFVVPTLTMLNTPIELASGQARMAALPQAAVVELEAPPDDDLDTLAEQLAEDGFEYGVPAEDIDRFVGAVFVQANNDPERLRNFRSKLYVGAIKFGGFKDDGTINWLRD